MCDIDFTGNANIIAHDKQIPKFEFCLAPLDDSLIVTVEIVRTRVDDVES